MENSPTEATWESISTSELSQLQREITLVEQSLKSEYKRIENLSTQLQLTSQQIQLFTKEVRISAEELKDCNWKISKEMCSELRTIPFPSRTLVDVCEKVMAVLGQPEKSFSAFRNLTKKFAEFKNLMSAAQNKSLSEEVINEILPVWKNHDSIQEKLIYISKCGCLLARWVYLVVDISLKNQTIISSTKREPELEKKIRGSQAICQELEKHLSELKDSLEDRRVGSNSHNENASEEYTQKFTFIEDMDVKMKKSIIDENFSFRNFVQFPNFQDDKLYAEKSMKISGISYESEEDHGCCKLRFLCF